MPEDRRDQVKNRLQALLDGRVRRRFLATEQDLQPCGPPMKLPQDRLKLRLGTWGDVQDDHAMEAPGHFDRIGNVVPLVRQRTRMAVSVALEEQAPALD